MLWRGQPLAGHMVAYLGHRLALKPTLTPREHLHTAVTLLDGHQPEARPIAELLEEAGLARLTDRPIARLSAGQQKRLALCTVALGQRPLWLLDEPLSNLDQQGAAWLETLLARHSAAHGVALLSIHGEPARIATHQTLQLGRPQHLITMDPAPGGQAAAPPHAPQTRTWWPALAALMGREARLAGRRLGEQAVVVLFFLLCTSLFGITLGQHGTVLAAAAGPVLMVCLLLAHLLLLDFLFSADLDDGSLYQLLLSKTPPALLILGKIAAHWLAAGAPLSLAGPLGGILMGYPLAAVPWLVALLLVVTLLLGLLGALCGALVLGLPRSGLLLALLVLPLDIPPALFTLSGLERAVEHTGALPPALMLLALLSGAVVLVPPVCAMALRLAAEQ
jgi:heme exporter protein B